MDNSIYIWLPAIVTAALMILGIIGISSRIKSATEELAHLFAVITTSLSDNKLTKEELEQIVKEAKEFIEALKTKK